MGNRDDFSISREIDRQVGMLDLSWRERMVEMDRRKKIGLDPKDLNKTAEVLSKTGQFRIFGVTK
jgi:hypothetical protein